jgi:hypothetical protein
MGLLVISEIKEARRFSKLILRSQDWKTEGSSRYKLFIKMNNDLVKKII